ncbi:MAG: sulfur carrier protein ThiS [Bacteroidales bacterium]
MQISVNNQPIQVETNLTLSQLLPLLNRSSQGIAIAINQQVIMRSKWEETILQEDDSVLIIQATCGG